MWIPVGKALRCNRVVTRVFCIGVILHSKIILCVWWVQNVGGALESVQIFNLVEGLKWSFKTFSSRGSSLMLSLDISLQLGTLVS